MKRTTINPNKISLLQRIHIDGWLLIGLLVLSAVGLGTLFSASGQDMGQMERQFIRLGFSFIVMFGLAQLPLGFYRFLSPYAFVGGLLMLIAVLLFGDMGKGAQRWLDLGFIRFQPSELMKLAVPMMVAWYISKFTLPPRTTHIVVGFALVVVPTILIAKQPDLGTSLLIASSGIFAIFLAGMSWRLISVVGALIGAFAPVMWFFLMKDYQKQRVLTFLNPESDPLGSGYHIIQSKIAIGSGGVDGKGWLQGTQSQLEFLPERHTDFIFAVFSEELFNTRRMYIAPIMILAGLGVVGWGILKKSEVS